MPCQYKSANSGGRTARPCAATVPRVVAPGRSWILNRPEQLRKCIITLLLRKSKRLCLRWGYHCDRNRQGRSDWIPASRLRGGRLFAGLTRVGWSRILGIRRRPAEIVDMAPQVCYTWVTPTTAQQEDKEAPVLADRRTAGRSFSRRSFVAPKEGTRWRILVNQQPP